MSVLSYDSSPASGIMSDITRYRWIHCQGMIICKSMAIQFLSLLDCTLQAYRGLRWVIYCSVLIVLQGPIFQLYLGDLSITISYEFIHLCTIVSELIPRFSTFSLTQHILSCILSYLFHDLTQQASDTQWVYE